MAQETQTGALYQPSRVGWGERWEGGSKGGDIGIPMADSGWRFDRKQQKSVKLLSFNKKFGEKMKTRRDFIFWGSKITAEGDCRREIKRCLLVGRKVMTNLDSVLIILPTKVHLVKAMVFPVVVYGCESWTIKKAEGRRMDAFELWCWRRLLQVPWTARRSNQSIVKEISP